MLCYESSIAIAAHRDAVWRVLAAVTAWPNWLPTITSIEPLHGAALSVGSKYKIVQPQLRQAVWVVTNVEPLHRFTWETRSPAVIVTADHTIDESSPGHSQVVLRVTFAGVLGPLLGIFVRSITKRYLAQEAAALKLTVERASGTPRHGA
jgi:hypothetical protein